VVLAKAGIIDLLSNNSDFAFTPDGLRKLATSQGTRVALSEPADFQIHRLSARLVGEQIADVVQRYVAGESARALAAEFGVAPSALIRLLRERSIVVRQQVVSPELEQLMAQEYETGLTVAELKDKHGISHGAVLRALHRAGVEMRAKAPRKKSA
jgi:DNA-directed RNA polymerase specialized sigma24 family protein